jgi:DNA-directed RNA polymerase subunit RPC12/RpoP
MNLICKDCGREFSFTDWEKEFFEKKGWGVPIRCVSCRRRKKVLKVALQDGIGISEQGMHEAVCGQCGREFLSVLEVRDSEKEYCSECWREIKGI